MSDIFDIQPIVDKYLSICTDDDKACRMDVEKMFGDCGTCLVMKEQIELGMEQLHMIKNNLDEFESKMDKMEEESKDLQETFDGLNSSYREMESALNSMISEKDKTCSMEFKDSVIMFDGAKTCSIAVDALQQVYGAYDCSDREVCRENMTDEAKNVWSNLYN
jgi:hypothetical protein